MEFEPLVNPSSLTAAEQLPGDGTGYTITAGKGARLQYFNFYRSGNSMVTIGFDDGTRGVFYNDVSGDDGNCTNTCATPRSPSLTNTRFIDCTNNFTNCFDNESYRSTFALNRTHNDNINQIKVIWD